MALRLRNLKDSLGTLFLVATLAPHRSEPQASEGRNKYICVVLTNPFYGLLRRFRLAPKM